MEDLLSMQNASAVLALACPAPFLPLSEHPYVAGQRDGRFCGPSPVDPQVFCCLPCPLTDWVYPDNFDLVSYIAGWVGVGSLVCCAYLLLSFAVLPAQRTSRHYLTICLILSILILEIAFAIPLGSKPDLCYDAITPNNLHTDTSCAVSGIFVLGGGFAGVMWVFIRSLSVHLQICWKIIPGTAFFWVAQVSGWGLTALFLALSVTMSGVSYRLGRTCHINHENSIATFWGPLLGFAGLSLMVQLATFVYCVKVYLQVANGPGGLPGSTTESSTLASNYSGSNRSAVMKRATYRRIRKVVALQWRGMTVVMIVLLSACYLATVFLLLDRDVSQTAQNFGLITPWVKCIAASKGDKDKCTDLTSPFILPERVVLPNLYLISIIGFWGLFFLGRWDMVLGWMEIFGRACGRRSGRSRSSSPSMHGRSQESFSTKMRGTPQHFHIVKGDRGLSIANKGAAGNTAFAMELMRSPSSQEHTDPNLDYFQSKDLESSYSSNPSQSQSQSQSHSNSDQSQSQSQHSYIAELPPHSFDRVWAAPRHREPGSVGRGSFNFSRPNVSPSQPTSDTPITPPPPPPPTITTTAATTVVSPHHQPAMTLLPATTYRDPERSNSATSGTWYMHNPPADEDTVPLSPILPPLVPHPTRPRVRADSRASSWYSFNVASYYGGPRDGGEGRSVHGPSRLLTPSPVPGHGSSGDRASRGMAWDPSSSFATAGAADTPTIPVQRPSTPASTGPHGGHTTNSSPALGRWKYNQEW